VSILSSCKQLTSLTLDFYIGQAEFDALLTHGTQLTSLTCSYLYLSEDRSASPCSWTELVMTQQEVDAKTLACLPLGSLTRLAFEGNAVFPSPCPTLQFTPLYRVDPDDMPELVRRSLVNLTRCPAWQQCGPGVHVRLVGDHTYGMPGLVSLVPALAPLASKEVNLAIAMPKGALGASAVQQLGVTLGSSLKQLVLESCELSGDFWPAVWAHLPGLQQLTVADVVSGVISAHELAVFCGRAARPLQLNLGHQLCQRVGPEGQLERQCRLWGVPQVTVTAVDI
jgi:hypothetical protein